MNELIVACARLWSRERIMREIEGHRYNLDMFHKLAMEFVNMDMRPLIVHGNTAERVGPNPIPHDLRALIADERANIARLEGELSECRDRS